MQIAWHEIIFVGKIAGGISTIGGVLYGSVRYIFRIIAEIQVTNSTVKLLATNHLPHIQSKLEENGKDVTALTSDVRNLDTKIDGMGERFQDMKTSVDGLSQAFVAHLDRNKDA